MMQGLAFCHGLGVHHRDIKLENLMLSKGADGELTVKLADFGLSDLRVLPFDLSGTFCGSLTLTLTLTNPNPNLTNPNCLTNPNSNPNPNPNQAPSAAVLSTPRPSS